MELYLAEKREGGKRQDVVRDGTRARARGRAARFTHAARPIVDGALPDAAKLLLVALPVETLLYAPPKDGFERPTEPMAP